jgi:hypothetical protein
VGEHKGQVSTNSWDDWPTKDIWKMMLLRYEYENIDGRHGLGRWECEGSEEDSRPKRRLVRLSLKSIQFIDSVISVNPA